MSFATLLHQQAQAFIKQELVNVPDGFGGMAWEWKDGDAFQAAVCKEKDSAMVVANQNGAKIVYKVVFDKSICLKLNDRIRHEESGQLYLITSDGADMVTPGSSPLGLAQCTAERVRV